MKLEKTNLLDWQKRYGNEGACAAALMQQRWPDGFVCPRCGHNHGFSLQATACMNARSANTTLR